MSVFIVGSRLFDVGGDNGAHMSTDGASEFGLVSESDAQSSLELEEIVAKQARKPYAGTNVFVSLPSGVIVRQGESIPPLVEMDKKEEELRTAVDEWNKIVKICSDGNIPGGRRVEYAEFSKALARFPRERQVENLKYAINLIDESNFLLIAAIVLDKGQPDELIATAFDACLNRDSPLTRAVIEEVAHDKTHPMYVDAARVVDIRNLKH